MSPEILEGLDCVLNADQDGYDETVWTAAVEELSSAGEFEGSEPASVMYISLHGGDTVYSCELPGERSIYSADAYMTLFVKL